MDIQAIHNQLDADPVAAFRTHANPARADILSRLPDHMLPGLVRYILFGLSPGRFLCCLIRGDWEGAIECADSTNRLIIDRYRDFLEIEAPMRCWGSDEAMNKWMSRGGLVEDGGRVLFEEAIEF